MNEQAIKARALHAAEISRLCGITQSQIAEAIGASQSQVSRILGGQGLRQTRLHEEVCLFVEHFGAGVTCDDVRKNEELVDAMRMAWDGSASHAKALSTVIRSLAALGSRPAHSAPTMDSQI